MKKIFFLYALVLSVMILLAACGKSSSEAQGSGTEVSPTDTSQYSHEGMTMPPTETPQVSETPKASETPQVETPKASETPIAETPNASETPKAETPKASETPKAEMPKMEMPKADTPKAEPPKAEAPKPKPTAAEPTGGKTNSASGDAVKSETYNVEIKDFDFSPKELKVKAGAKITFTNKDKIKHTATVDGVFDSGLLDQNQSYTVTLDKAGEYNVYCQPHPFMELKITVE